MAIRSTSSDNLREAMASLVRAQAKQVEMEWEMNDWRRESDARWNEWRSESDARWIELRRIGDERWQQVVQALHDHEARLQNLERMVANLQEIPRLLANLPEAIRQKMGFHPSPEPGQQP